MFERLPGRFIFSLPRVQSTGPHAVSESFPKENDFELSDKTGDQKSDVSRLRLLTG